MKFFITVPLVSLFFIFPTLLFSQLKTGTSVFETELKNKSDKFSDETYFHRARFFFLNKEWDSTLVYSDKHLSTSSENTELKDYSHFFRGYSFKQKKLFNESYKEFASISESFRFRDFVTLNLGEIALEQKEFKKAIQLFEVIESLDTYKLFGIRNSAIAHNLGICYLHLEEFDASESYLIKSAKKQESEGDTLLIIGAYGDIANLYYVQYKDDLAIPYFKKAYELSKKVKDFEPKRRTALNMAVVEENRKDFKAALVYRKEFEKWKDSLNDQNKIWEVAALEKQFAVRQKQKEVSLLQAENKIKIAERNGLFYSAVVLLLLLVTGIFFYKEKTKANKIITAQKEDLDELNATKDKLFSVVSHDLRSSVSALKKSNTVLLDHLEAKNLERLDHDLQTNNAIVNGAYRLLDNLLHWALLQTKQSYFEIAPLRLYPLVEQMVYNYKPLMIEKNIRFENKVSKKDRVLADQESLKLVLRNVLDNAIKFSNTNGLIQVFTANTYEGYVDLVIEDTGSGMSEETRLALLKDTAVLPKRKHKDAKGTGLGLQLCKSVIRKNNGKFNIESKPGHGTKIIVSLPKTEKND
ncbi:tetratricopeptide repeat-containing sensor histidine kinase [Aureisphaera galaxeae]|uniref:tetratricopeptide repeat-containing sensor histidine kinase n=1 Tax=Aureisphaera galaxeae TaxID=1538023 RepID=UPI0023500ED7|nr:tetratricopeptide repeat-containing sensor histidine kinase [Aureisphaera galaxeae]MDC8005196.1 tetratricopeptide repeat-containing sensor histidine kinase [Aureisphaera galaxeae]